MQKLSFIKGLLIGGIFSAFFWVGAYYTVSTILDNHTSQEQPQLIQPTNLSVRATL